MPSITDMIDARIAKFFRALRLPYRARLSALNGDPALQMAQGKGLAGEAVQAVEVLQQFGFSSGIPADSQLIVLPLAGSLLRSTARIVSRSAPVRPACTARRGHTSISSKGV